jgi:putative endopeptidase
MLPMKNKQPRETQRSIRTAATLLAGCLAATVSAHAQAPAATTPPVTHYEPAPSLDLSMMNRGADPCTDFYAYTCGNYTASHPIPADQGSASQFSNLNNVNTQNISGILTKAAAGGPSRSPNEQKIGDYYAACMNTDLIEQKGLSPVLPLMSQIDGTSKLGLAPLIGRLQRMGVDVFFGYGEMQDFKDASKQIAEVDQGGLGLPEKDYYLRTGAKDEQIRQQYVTHVEQMLLLSGTPAAQATRDARAILAFETQLAKASQSVTERRDPAAIYHLEPIAEFERSIGGVNFSAFLNNIHSPEVEQLNVVSPAFFPAMVKAVRDTDDETLHAYMRYHLLTTFAARLPTKIETENFHFYATVLNGVPQQQAQWKRCSSAVNGALGEALGEVYVKQFFAGDSKQKMLTMVNDIESAMATDIDHLDWMSPETKVRAKEKLHLVANKIGYPDKFRDYTKLIVKRDDAVGNSMRANEFENDRELDKIGKPVDPTEWSMTPPTVNAYYDPSMNNINFPAGILQPAFYDPKADAAVNYGHIGAVIGHELTHGFDDEGRKFDGKGNLSDWWTAADAKNYEQRSDCLANEYDKFVAVDDVHVNGKLTLGENTADNGGVVLAYMAYLERAKRDGTDVTKKSADGFTPQQQFFVAYGQNWCGNFRPEQVRSQVLSDPHSPGRFRVDGVVINTPAFANAFSCKRGTPMAPVKSCRVW